MWCLDFPGQFLPGEDIMGIMDMMDMMGGDNGMECSALTW